MVGEGKREEGITALIVVRTKSVVFDSQREESWRDRDRDFLEERAREAFDKKERDR